MTNKDYLGAVACVVFASFACAEQARNEPSRAPSSSTATTLEAEVLGTSANFLVLGASTVTNTGPTVISGDLGLSSGTSITGFPPGLVNGAIHAADGPADQAQIDLNLAWTAVQNEPCDQTLSNAELGGLTLTAGVYCFTSPSAGLTGALTLDAEGAADAMFVFKIASTLTTATNSSVVMVNGGSDCNIFWGVGSSATLGTDSLFRGNILASASITVTTGATIFGRLLADTAAVTLDNNRINDCALVLTDAGAGDDAGQTFEDAAIIEADAGIAESDAAGFADAAASEDASTEEVDAGAPDRTCGDCVCEVYQACCADVCVDLTCDSQNCGACGVACGAGESCQNGTCQL